MLIYLTVLNEISPLIAFKKKKNSTMEFFVISLFDLTLEARLHLDTLHGFLSKITSTVLCLGQFLLNDNEFSENVICQVQ